MHLFLANQVWSASSRIEEYEMTHYQRSTLFTVLILSTALLTFNIFIVTTGMADSYYAEIQRWIEAQLH